MWDLIVSVPDHCLSFYFDLILVAMNPAGAFLRRVVYGWVNMQNSNLNALFLTDLNVT